MAEVIMPASLKIDPVAGRLVGRRYDTLTETEERLSEHFGLHGDLYWASIDPEQWTIETDLGHPGARVVIRIHPEMTPAEAAWDLARVVDYINANRVEGL